jgi:hypothetical protein
MLWRWEQAICKAPHQRNNPINLRQCWQVVNILNGTKRRRQLSAAMNHWSDLEQKFTKWSTTPLESLLEVSRIKACNGLRLTWSLKDFLDLWRACGGSVLCPFYFCKLLCPLQQINRYEILVINSSHLLIRCEPREIHKWEILKRKEIFDALSPSAVALGVRLASYN